MIIKILNPSQNSYNLLRDCGYSILRDPQNPLASYTRRLTRNFYPRFHIYVNQEKSDFLELNLHLDQKHASYAGQTAHSGEYSGELLEQEAQRIQSSASTINNDSYDDEPVERGFWSKIFG